MKLKRKLLKLDLNLFTQKILKTKWYKKSKFFYTILGRKHTKESVEKMRNRIISEETLIKVRKHLSELNKNKRISVEVIDTEINITTEYKSIKLAALSLNANATTLSRYLKSQKLRLEGDAE